MANYGFSTPASVGDNTMKAKLVGKHLGYEAAKHAMSITTDFYVKLGYWPDYIMYPADHPPQLTNEERKKLRQEYGVQVVTRAKNSPLALAGPLHAGPPHVE